MRIARLERAHDDLACVHPNANFYWLSACLAKSVAIIANLALHPERRVQRAPRMVFVGYGSAEECEDAVAGILHVAIVTTCRIDHYFQRRVDDCARFLRVEVPLEFGRALDVGEQRGDRLALAFQILRSRCFSHPNGCVVQPRRWGCDRRVRPKRVTAGIAELCIRAILRSAGGTFGRKLCATLVTEACAFSIVSTALGAAHCGSPKWLARRSRLNSFDGTLQGST